MRLKKRQQVIRTILSALLDSDLSWNEINAVADELKYGDLHQETAYLLKRLTKHMSAFDGLEEGHHSGSERSEELYRIVQRRRTSKRELLETIRSISSKAYEKADLKMTVRELLDSFYQNSSDHQIKELETLLGGSSPRDPYLKGILNRGERQ